MSVSAASSRYSKQGGFVLKLFDLGHRIEKNPGWRGAVRSQDSFTTVLSSDQTESPRLLHQDNSKHQLGRKHASGGGSGVRLGQMRRVTEFPNCHSEERFVNS